MSGASPSRSPITRTRTLLPCNSARSLRMKRRSRPMRSRTSAGGRDQFSELNEKMVRMPTPSSPAARTVRRSASTPRRWPSLRGSPRAAAQRPLPSMMMATCRGASNGAGEAINGTSGIDMAVRESCDGPCVLDGHDFFFFGGERMVDFGNGFVGRLLDQVGLVLVIVLADLVVLFELFEDVEAVAPYVPHGHAGVLRVFVRDLDQFPAPLLVELGNAQPQYLALGRWARSEERRVGKECSSREPQEQ